MRALHRRSRPLDEFFSVFRFCGFERFAEFAGADDPRPEHSSRVRRRPGGSGKNFDSERTFGNHQFPGIVDHSFEFSACSFWHRSTVIPVFGLRFKSGVVLSRALLEPARPGLSERTRGEIGNGFPVTTWSKRETGFPKIGNGFPVRGGLSLTLKNLIEVLLISIIYSGSRGRSSGNRLMLMIYNSLLTKNNETLRPNV